MKAPVQTPLFRLNPLVGGLWLLGALGALAALWGAPSRAPIPCDQPVVTGTMIHCDGRGAPIGARAWLVGQGLNLNMATQSELSALPGIGRKTAANIVAERSQNGAFATVDDLQRTRGIGPKTIERLRPWLVVKP